MTLLIIMLMIAVAIAVGKFFKYMNTKIEDIDEQLKTYINEQREKEKED